MCGVEEEVKNSVGVVIPSPVITVVLKMQVIKLCLPLSVYPPSLTWVPCSRISRYFSPGSVFGRELRLREVYDWRARMI